MAETHFFAMPDDAVALCGWFIESFGCTFLLDQSAEEIPPEFQSVDEIREVIDGMSLGPRFFIRCTEWGSFPVPYARCTNADGIPSNYICQRYGGPLLDLKLCNVFDHEQKIVVGWLIDYPYYYKSKDSNETFPRPESMTEAMKAARNYLRQHGSKTFRRDTGKQTSYRSLQGATAKYKEGWTLMQGAWVFEPRKAEQGASTQPSVA